MAEINRLTNANVYLNGSSAFGKAEEVTLPQVKAKQTAYKALGMLGEMEYPSGFEKMEAKIKWNAWYPDIMKILSNVFDTVNVQVRSSLETFDNSGLSVQKPVVVYFRGRCKNAPSGTFKQNDNLETDSDFTVEQYKLEIDGVTIVEIDLEASIYIVDGVDMMAAYRANLGIN
jgi:P2 family phage contractile tail tube protein